MEILTLRLKGFIGIKMGPNRDMSGPDEITIDFSKTSGLTALDGINGTGKSTVLENLHPYPTLASRSGALFNHVYIRNAEKEFSFAYQGDHYRTLLKIDCQSEKTEGYIYKNGATKSETTGKIKEYSKYIANLLGSELMFFNSVFCAQNSTKLSDMKTAEFKTLLGEFIGSQKYVGWEDDCKDKITAVTGQLEQIEKRLLVVNNKLAGFGDIKAKLATAHDDLVAQEKTIKQLRTQKAKYQDKLESLKEKKSNQEVLIAQKANIEARIKELETQLGKEQYDADTDLNSLRVAYKDLQGQIKKDEELLQLADDINVAADKEKEIQEELEILTAKFDKLTMEGPEKNQAVHDLEIKITTIYQQQKSLLTDPENLRLGKLVDEAERAVADRERQIKDLSNDSQLAAIEEQIKSIEKAAKVGEGIKADCKETTCGAIAAVLEAKEQLPLSIEKREARKQIINETVINLKSAIADIKELTETVLNEKMALMESIKQFNENIKSDIKSATEELENAKKFVSETNEAINKYRQELATLRFELGKNKDLAAKKTALEVAKTQYDNVTRQMEENVARGKELKVKWENRKIDLDGSIKDASASLNEINGRIDNDIEAQISLIAIGQYNIDRDLPEMELNLNTIRASIMRFESDLEVKGEVESEIETARMEKEKLQQDISDWTYLKIACGKNGLQAMEIAGAAPIITSFANQLLTRTFNCISTVRLRTLDDEGKECLGILIMGDDGKETLLDNLSGGQKVPCLMALRLAMTLLNKEKSGRNFETFFSDEMDGALDPENALNFVNMYRSFMEIGAFQDGYFISHKPPCRALADNNLMFEAGKNPAWS